MTQYLVAIHHPDDYDPSAEDEAMSRDIDALNHEMVAAGVRIFHTANTHSTPQFFITFFSYRHHRPAPQSVPALLDRAPSRNSPVSRDERISRHFSTALSQHIAATSTPASTRQIAKFDAKSNVFKILRITSLM